MNFFQSQMRELHALDAELVKAASGTGRMHPLNTTAAGRALAARMILGSMMRTAAEARALLQVPAGGGVQ